MLIGHGKRANGQIGSCGGSHVTNRKPSGILSGWPVKLHDWYFTWYQLAKIGHGWQLKRRRNGRMIRRRRI